MMCRTLFILVLLPYVPALNAQSADARRAAVEGLRREANRFIEAAIQVQGSESLTQTVAAQPRVRSVQRQVVSSYGFLSLHPGEVREIRQVQSVDGKRAKKRGDPLKNLAENLMAADDTQRRKLLESFEKHGLQGVAVDFGPVIQMFSGDKVLNFEFLYQRMDRMGGAPVAVYLFEQIDGAGGLTIFANGKPIRQKLRGEVWITPADGAPARIILDSLFDEGASKMRDVTAVDYMSSDFGTLLPSTVVHRQYRDRTVLVEDLFRYSEYRKAQ